MATAPQQITAIALLLATPKSLDRETVQRAADFAFHGAPKPPTATAITGKPLFRVASAKYSQHCNNRWLYKEFG